MAVKGKRDSGWIDFHSSIHSATIDEYIYDYIL